MIAVIKTGGKQYIVTEGQTLKIEKIPASNKKKNGIVFSEVLLTAGKDQPAIVGSPTVPGITVEASLVREGKAKKIRVVKYKSKVRYRRLRGHRQEYTEVKIEKITAKK